MAKKTKAKVELVLLDPARFPSKKAIRGFVKSPEFYVLFQACIDTLISVPGTQIRHEKKELAREISWYILDELRNLLVAASLSGPMEAIRGTVAPDDYFGLVRSLEALVHHQSMVCAEGELVFSLKENLPPVLQVLDGLHERKAEFLPNGWCVGGA